jgi:hypothetical protein
MMPPRSRNVEEPAPAPEPVVERTVRMESISLAPPLEFVPVPRPRPRI